VPLKLEKTRLSKHILILAAALALPLAAQQGSAPVPPVIVQPGAPGHPNKTLTPTTAQPPNRPPSDADIKFMQGMIMHHGQAVEMTHLLETHSKNPEVQALGQRITISQTDEMGFMKRWLTDRGLPLTMPMNMDMGGPGMEKMDMSKMDMSDMMPPMPGMLTRRQMEALRNASGPAFDHLFLTGMIQHHTGALTMVQDLFATPAAAQDPVLFDFATDVDNTQLAEIDFMKHMLAHETSKEKK
jgi:uncharacterized protein (DUF305 family)